MRPRRGRELLRSPTRHCRAGLRICDPSGIRYFAMLQALRAAKTGKNRLCAGKLTNFNVKAHSFPSPRLRYRSHPSPARLERGSWQSQQGWGRMCIFVFPLVGLRALDAAGRDWPGLWINITFFPSGTVFSTLKASRLGAREWQINPLTRTLSA